jgi:PAS domain S-box-containing protein
LIVDESLLSAIFELSSEAVWMIDFRTGVRSWIASEENRHKFDIPDGVVPADYWQRNLHPEYVEQATQGFERALLNPRSSSFQHEYLFRGRDNFYYRISDSMRFLRNSQGMAERVVGVWRDVTETRVREQKLEEILNDLERGRDRFKIFSEVSSAAMWEVDFLTNRVYWTAGSNTLEALGLTKEMYSMLDWEVSVHPEDRDRVVKNFKDAVASGGENYFDTYRVIQADGTVAYMIDQGAFIRDTNGNAIRAFGTWTNITRERERENALENALQRQRQLNDEVSAREEALAASEEALRASNEQLRITLRETANREFILNQAQKIAHIGSWEYDFTTNRMLWSEELYNIYGLEKDFDINEGSLYQQLFIDKGRWLESYVNDLINYGTPFDLTLQARTPLGYRKWVRIVGFPVWNEEKVIGISGVTHDITQYKESEERLRASEEKFSQAFKNNPELMSICRESDRVVVDVNDNVLPLLGYERQEVIGRSVEDFHLYVSEEDRDRYLEVYLRDRQVQMETLWRRKDGRVVDVFISSSRIEIEGAYYTLYVIQDISQRKAAEERFTKAFDLGPDLMLIFRERDWALLEVNSKLMPVGGYIREEVIGKASVDFALWADPEDRKRYIEQLGRSESAFIEAPLLRKDGSVYFGAVSAKRIQLSNESHILVVVRDITEKRRVEEKIRQSEANLISTINNTSLMVWSVDRDSRVITYNRPLADFVYTYYGIVLREGEHIVPYRAGDPESQRLRALWDERYMRALAGETYRITDHMEYGLFFDFSVSPIIERDQIIGVSVFGEDVTKRREDESSLAEAYKQIGELRLMALRSVMNPHFIFNALNSIQYFIAQNDRKNAINYLSTFSKLIRGILTNSVNTKIKLHEEMEQLNHYVQLELMRFENKFKLVLDIDPDVDTENIEIPSLLIQPYVENAILHGLYNKTEAGILRIAVREEGDTVLFEIEDDGVGRTEAMKLRNQNFPKHKSMGTALTEERLKLINERENVAVETNDLFDAHDVPCGTRVKIRVRI